jgi:hypothetical protein
MTPLISNTASRRKHQSHTRLLAISAAAARAAAPAATAARTPSAVFGERQLATRILYCEVIISCERNEWFNGINSDSNRVQGNRFVVQHRPYGAAAEEER